MSGQEWDHHRRLVTQAKDDQSAQAARAAVAANAAVLQAQARGRSQQRGSGNRGRLLSAEELSRSRSRSFNLPLRGWGIGGGGERRQRWMSQDSAPAADEGEPVGSGIGLSESSSGGLNGSGSVGGETSDETEVERSRRNRSFFAFTEKLGVMGGGRRRPTPAAEAGGTEDQAVATDSTDGDGNDRGRKKSFSMFGGGERRRARSTAGTIGSADRGVGSDGGDDDGSGGTGGGGAGTSRSRMLSSSSRDTIAPSIDPSPPSAHGVSSSNPAVATTASIAKPAGVSAADATVTKNVASRSRSDRRLPGGFGRSNSLGRDDGRAVMDRTRTASAAVISAEVKPSQHRGRALSTAAAELQHVTAESPVPTSEHEPCVGEASAVKSSRWKLPRRRRSTGTTIDDAGAAMGKKSVWGSLQVCRV